MKNSPSVLFHSSLANLQLLQRGKVRDIYHVDEQHILIVATDRLSAFDVVMPTPIPGKGRVLTDVANFWFYFFEPLIPNHLSAMKPRDVLPDDKEREQVQGRAIIAKKLRVLPIEAIVRGYLIGSGWTSYQKTGAVCGVSLHAGLGFADQLPHAIYTPSTKADVAGHDVNIDFNETVKLIGRKHAEQMREISLEIYTRAAEYALDKGIIIADTKFEFGLDGDKLVLIDEVLTPDSSRFWSADQYQPGFSPPSYDKQYVRDYLETLEWNKVPPGPKLPPDVVSNTAEKYLEAQKRLVQ